jgi:hypothetical protein
VIQPRLDSTFIPVLHTINSLIARWELLADNHAIELHQAQSELSGHLLEAQKLSNARVKLSHETPHEKSRNIIKPAP